MAKTQAQCDMTNPEEMFAWCFTAGVPDPRGQGKFPNQPLIPPACFLVLSKMLYDMGARFHPELQTLWVKSSTGPDRNFQASGTTDIKPEDIFGDVAAMAADQFPQVVESLSKLTPAAHQAALNESAGKLLDNLAALKAAREKLDAQTAGGGKE